MDWVNYSKVKSIELQIECTNMNIPKYLMKFIKQTQNSIATSQNIWLTFPVFSSRILYKI